jgi:hypothetical protein
MSGKAEPTLAVWQSGSCKALRQTALNGADSASSIANERSVDAGDRMRVVADQIPACAAIMQREIGRFLAVARRRRS